jgi:hypothetical protein
MVVMHRLPNILLHFFLSCPQWFIVGCIHKCP